MGYASPIRKFSDARPTGNRATHECFRARGRSRRGREARRPRGAPATVRSRLVLDGFEQLARGPRLLESPVGHVPGILLVEDRLELPTRFRVPPTPHQGLAETKPDGGVAGIFGEARTEEPLRALEVSAQDL